MAETIQIFVLFGHWGWIFTALPKLQSLGVYTLLLGILFCPKYLFSRESLTKPLPQLCAYTYSFSALHLWFFCGFLFYYFSCFPESLEAEEKGGSEGNSVPNDERNWKLEAWILFSVSLLVRVRHVFWINGLMWFQRCQDSFHAFIPS